jgi:hypothetical protein
MMDKIQGKYEDEQIKKAANNLLPPPVKKVNEYALPAEGSGNKFGGFFTN